MKFTSETTEMGVTERGFDIEVSGEHVPGIIWAPEGAKGPRPLLLVGHGGTAAQARRGRARRGAGTWPSTSATPSSPSTPRTTVTARRPSGRPPPRANIEERMRNRVQQRPAGGLDQMRERARKPWASGRRPWTLLRSCRMSAKAPSAGGASPWALRTACRSSPPSRGSRRRCWASTACARARTSFASRPEGITDPAAVRLPVARPACLARSRHRPLRRLRFSRKDHAHQPRRPHRHSRLRARSLRRLLRPAPRPRGGLWGQVSAGQRRFVRALSRALRGCAPGRPMSGPCRSAFPLSQPRHRTARLSWARGRLAQTGVPFERDLRGRRPGLATRRGRARPICLCPRSRSGLLPQARHLAEAGDQFGLEVVTQLLEVDLRP